MNSLIEVKNLTKTFSGTKYLNNISLRIDLGEVLLIAGANGSGKTLLMKHLSGLISLKKDNIFYNGKDCYKNEKLLNRNVGLIFQNPDTQIIGLTVKDDIAFGLKNLGFSKREIEIKVDKVIKLLNISHLKEKNPHILSGGEKKRVNIAGVLVMEPKIIIFDEPFIGLDFPGVISVTKSIIKLKELGETIVVISHDLEKVAAYCDRVVIMNSGEIKADGVLKDFINDLEAWGIRRPFQSKIEDMTWLI